MSQKNRKDKSAREFYPISPEIGKKLRKAGLTSAEWRIWTYLIEVDPWGDRYQDIDMLSIMSECQCSKATVYRAIAKFQDLDLFDFQLKGMKLRNQEGISKMKSRLSSETTVSKLRRLSQDCESRRKNETSFSELRQVSQDCENESLEPLPDKDSTEPQINKTIQIIHTLQKGRGGSFDLLGEECGELSHEEEEEEEESTPSQLGDVLKRFTGVDEKVNDTEIPDDLLKRLERLGIPLDEKVKSAIAFHHISQAYGAAAHVEKTWESIKNAKAVFLHQISQQKVEIYRGPTKTLEDLNLPTPSLDELKHLYPHDWQNAAAHFNLEITEVEPEENEEQERQRKKELIKKYRNELPPNQWQRIAKSLGIEE